MDMEAAGNPLYASSDDVDEEVHRGAILLMGFTRPWYLKIPLWPGDPSNRWPASPPTAADYALPAPCGGDDERPSTSAVMWLPDDFPDWGRQRKRSRTAAHAGIREGADARSWSEKKVTRRASPQSPLEGYSSASASGGEDSTRWPSASKKVSRSPYAGVAVAAAAASLPPSTVQMPCAFAAVSFPGDGSQSPSEMEEVMERRGQASSRATSPTVAGAPGPIVRPTGKKLKKVELKAQEKWLLEERAKIQQELKELGRAVEVVKAERRELELRLKSPKTEAKAAEAQKVVAPSGSQTILSIKYKLTEHIELPDLNDPLPVFVD